MALSGPIAWDVRTTGDDNNGGGFNQSAAGTDYSQQNAAQKSGTDLAIHASINTKVQPVAAGVAAADVGNLIKITAGTGFTTGVYEITAQDGTYWTLDRAAGTTGSTGGTYKMGGARQTIASAVGDAVTSNEIHIKSGTYTITSQIDTSSKNMALYGFGSSHLDQGTKPLITTSTNSIAMINGAGFGFKLGLSNLSFSTTAGTPGTGFKSNSGSLTCSDCIFDGFQYGFDMATVSLEFLRLFRVEIKNCTSYGLYGHVNAYSCILCDCYIHDNSIGFYSAASSNNDGAVVIVRSRIVDNTTIGIKQVVGQSPFVLIGNTIANNGTDGVEMLGVNQSYFEVYNNIFYGNGGYAINYTHGSSTTTSRWSPLRNGPNAYGANASGNFRTIGAGVNDVTLTADPFTNAAGGDYTLNSVSGGGAACQNAGLQG